MTRAFERVSRRSECLYVPFPGIAALHACSTATLCRRHASREVFQFCSCVWAARQVGQACACRREKRRSERGGFTLPLTMFSLGLKLYHVALGKRARDEDTDISAGARPKTNHTTSASELHDLPTPPSAPPKSSGDSSPADEAPADPAAAQEDGSPHALAQAASSPVAASGILPGTLKTVAECYADETLEQADTTVYPPDETLNSKVSIWCVPSPPPEHARLTLRAGEATSRNCRSMRL